MKIRLNELVVDRGLAETHEAAKRMILAGQILVDGHRADKPGRKVDDAAALEFKGKKPRYVSRGGLKLEAALERFDVEIRPGCVAMDIGASTGGFTDCLLQHGAGRVLAVDTGRGQVHERLRRDDRVTLLERTNARNLRLDAVGGKPVDLIVIDVSFISLRLILPVCSELLRREGDVVALVKPQFEARREKVGRGGIVRDPAVHAEVLRTIIEFCVSEGWSVQGLIPSPLLGAEGNVEFLAWLRYPADASAAPGRAQSRKIDIETVVRDAYNSAHRG